MTRKAESTSERVSPGEVARRFWDRAWEGPVEEMGIFPLGECGPAEVLYRQYEELRHIKRLAIFDQRKDVLELGAGNGRWILALAPNVQSYTAVELSKAMLDAARERVARRGLRNVTFVESSAQAYVPDRTFDIIYLSGMSQFLEADELEALLRRMRACLKPGGVLIDRTTVHLRRHTLSGEPGYYSIYRTAEGFLELFERAGWRLSYRAPSYRYLGFPERLKRLVRRRSSHWLVRATAPLSHHVLRASALLSSRLREPGGAMRDFSHDFFVFEPKSA